MRPPFGGQGRGRRATGAPSCCLLLVFDAPSPKRRTSYLHTKPTVECGCGSPPLVCATNERLCIHRRPTADKQCPGGLRRGSCKCAEAPHGVRAFRSYLKGYAVHQSQLRPRDTSTMHRSCPNPSCARSQQQCHHHLRHSSESVTT